MAGARDQSIDEAMWAAKTRRIGAGMSEYGVPTGGPVTETPVPGTTDPNELRGDVTMTRRKTSRAFVEN